MRMQGKTKHIYAEAERDIHKKLDDFLARFKAEDERRKKLVDAGEMSKAEYDAWRRGQVFRGKRWQALRDEIVDQIYGSNKTAARIMNDERRSVFIQNANRTAYELEKKTRGAVSFELYDSATVTRLIKEDQKLLPEYKVNQRKDYKWNNREVNNALTQSIIQGESMDELAGRIAKAVSRKNDSLMYSFARTMMTGAQNAGRQEAMREARDMGIKLKKRWLATLDSRTRDTHRDLDGVSVDVDKPFIIGDRTIMFPGDPNADADLVFNCRCTLIYDYEDYPANIQRRDNETGEAIDWMTYREWEKMKQGQAVTVEEPISEQTFDIRGMTKMLASTLDEGDYNEAVEMIERSETAKLYNRFGDACRNIKRSQNGGAYSPFLDSVDYSFSKNPGQSKYSTMAHEMGHMFDKHIGRSDALTYSEVDLINSKCVIGSGTNKTLEVEPSISDQFLRAMREDKANLRRILSDKEAITEMKTGLNRNATAGIQDAMDGFFGTQKKCILPWGHGEKYYNRMYNKRIKSFDNEANLKSAFIELGFDASNQAKVKRIARDYETASELWANCVSALTCGGRELEAFKKYMPKTVEAARSIIGGI